MFLLSCLPFKFLGNGGGEFKFFGVLGFLPKAYGEKELISENPLEDACLWSLATFFIKFKSQESPSANELILACRLRP